MALSARAAVAAPYAQRLLYDKEVQAVLRRAVGATRDAYARGRGHSARQAVNDKKLRRNVQQAFAALGEVWSTIGEPAPRRKSRWRGRLAALALGGTGVFLALNPEVREKLLGMVGKNDA